MKDFAGKFAVITGGGTRQAPEKAYTSEFYKSLTEEVGWRLG